MHWLYWIVIGLFAGGLAKAISPGQKAEPKGCLMTILLGIAGSLLVGFLMHDVFHMSTGNGFIGSIVGATIGALVLIFLFRKFWANGGTTV